MKITSDYDKHTKEELVKEAQSRKLETVDIGMKKEDIIAELELSDEPAQPKSPLPPLKASTIPQLPKVLESELPRIAGQDPKDEDYNDGIFTESSSGEPYALCVVEDGMAVDSKTHFLKNSVHFWNGTKQQFKEQFEKK